MEKQLKNIDMILYGNFYTVWLENENINNLIELFNLDWEWLWNTADKKFIESKERVFNRIKEIEKEIERRRGIK